MQPAWPHTQPIAGCRLQLFDLGHHHRHAGAEDPIHQIEDAWYEKEAQRHADGKAADGGERSIVDQVESDRGDASGCEENTLFARDPLAIVPREGPVQLEHTVPSVEVAKPPAIPDTHRSGNLLHYIIKIGNYIPDVTKYQSVSS